MTVTGNEYVRLSQLKMLGDKIQTGGGTFTITDNGTSTGFPRTAMAGERVSFQTSERYSSYSISDEYGNDIPISTTIGATSTTTVYYFIMPSCNVKTHF